MPEKQNGIKIMHTIEKELEIEFLNSENEYDTISVLFIAEVSCDDDSFSYEYGSERRSSPSSIYAVIDSIGWDRSLYSNYMDSIIQCYVDDNKESVEKELLKS